LVERVRPEDIVILHDPQTAGLAPHVNSLGATVIWRCHVGVDIPDDLVRSAWAFLAPYLALSHLQIFSRRSYVWDVLDPQRVVVQVSRWDRLKDPVGVLRGFAEHVPESTGSHLVLAGPAVDGVDDDPEGRAVLSEARSAWQALQPRVRRRVHLACLPMADDD